MITIQVSSILPHIGELRRMVNQRANCTSFALVKHVVGSLVRLWLCWLAKLAHHIVSSLHHLLLTPAAKHPSRFLLAIIVEPHLIRRALLELAIVTNCLALHDISHLLSLHGLVVLGLALHHGMIASLRHRLLLPHVHQSLVRVSCSVLIAIHLLLHLLLVSGYVVAVDSREQVSGLLEHVI